MNKTWGKKLTFEKVLARSSISVMDPMPSPCKYGKIVLLRTGLHKTTSILSEQDMCSNEPTS